MQKVKNKMAINILDEDIYTKCPKCGYHEAIFFQNPNINDPGMKLVFVCCNKNDGIYCGYSWFDEEESK